MLKRLASVAALFSSAAMLTACTTSAGKPQECLPAFVMKNRCAKIPQSVKDATRAQTVAPNTVKPKPFAAPQRLDAYDNPR